MNARMPGTSEYSTPSDREIRVVRAFSAPRKLVYEAMSNPKHVPKWMTGPEGVTMPVCEMDLRRAASGASSTACRTGRR
jgi:uncharacterized protein YndB with AHSA1/START domain